MGAHFVQTKFKKRRPPNFPGGTMKVTDSDICERCDVGPVAGYALAEPGATLMFIALCEKCLDTIEDDWKTGAEKIAEWQNRAQANWP
jgi:hypothetical protein